MLLRKKLETIITNNKIFAYILIIFVAGVLMLVLCGDEKNTALNAKEAMVSNYSTEDELRIENVLSQIEGVGKIKVLINYNEKTSSSFLFEKSEDETDSKNYTGVIVSAEGADNSIVSNIIKESISTFLGIPLHKIVVYKMV